MTPSAGSPGLLTRISFAMHCERFRASPGSCKAWSLSMAPVLGAFVRTRPRQVGLAHGPRAGPKIAAGVGAGGCRCPIEQDHSGAEVAQNADLERRHRDRQIPLNWRAHCRPGGSSRWRAMMRWRSKPIRARSTTTWFCFLTIGDKVHPSLAGCRRRSWTH
jgi:hypothetical protein